MSVKFSIYSTPQPSDRDGKPLKHARILSKGTKRMDEICEEISEGNSLTSSDLKAALDALFNCISRSLTKGYTVELDDLGIFSLALKSKQVTNEDGKGVTEVMVDGVNFRCSKRLKEQVRGARLSKVKRAVDKDSSIDDRKKRMIEHIQTNGFITGLGYKKLNTCSKHVAYKEIKQFLEDGLIVNVGRKNLGVFQLAK